MSESMGTTHTYSRKYIANNAICPSSQIVHTEQQNALWTWSHELHNIWFKDSSGICIRIPDCHWAKDLYKERTRERERRKERVYHGDLLIIVQYSSLSSLTCLTVIWDVEETEKRKEMSEENKQDSKTQNSEKAWFGDLVFGVVGCCRWLSQIVVIWI